VETATELLVVKHAECFFDAALETLNSACGMEAAAHSDSEQSLAPGANSIIAVISLVGDVEWSLTLGLPQDTAVAVAQKFTGFSVPFDSSDMGDAIGELANVIAGSVKARLDQRGTRANLSLPTVLRGSAVESVHLQNVRAMRQEVQSPSGAMWLALVEGNKLVATRQTGS
jgi:chemotaxis protein CheX